MAASGEQIEQHQAMDGVVNLLSKANHDLTVVHNRLQKEFQQIYPPHANPMKLVSRIKKIQDELPSLQEECRLLLSAKQDLIDKARTILVGNRSSLQRLQASMGVHVTSDSDDSAYTNFNQVIDEWNEQIRSRTASKGLFERNGVLEYTSEMEDESCCESGSGSENINQMLFSAIVQGN